MTWNYTNRPIDVPRDRVRFLVGDVDVSDPLVSDEEVAFAISEYPASNEFAAAFILRALAARFSRKVSMTVGGVASSCSDLARAFAQRATELDPNGETTGNKTELVLPSFGGLKISEKETLKDDIDAVQPAFAKGMDDIPGGPADSITSDELLGRVR
jgi:hypothetical protein